MKSTSKCPKCGSRDIIRDAKPIAGSDYGDLLIATFRKPEAVLFKGLQTSKLSAWVCTDCGFLELYADDPKRLQV